MSRFRRTRGKSLYNLAVLFHVKIKLIFFPGYGYKNYEVKDQSMGIMAFDYCIKSSIYLIEEIFLWL